MRRRRAWMSLLSAGGLLVAPALLRAQAQGQTVLLIARDGCTSVFNSHFKLKERS